MKLWIVSDDASVSATIRDGGMVYPSETQAREAAQDGEIIHEMELISVTKVRIERSFSKIG